MPKSYSIAEARNELPGLIHDVERSGPVTITRRGKLVAVLLSVEEYERIAPAVPTFTQAYEAWKRSVDKACRWACLGNLSGNGSWARDRSHSVAGYLIDMP